MPPTTPPEPGARPQRLLLGAALFVAAAAGGALFFAATHHPRAGGNVISKGPALGDWTLAPDVCRDARRFEPSLPSPAAAQAKTPPGTFAGVWVGMEDGGGAWIALHTDGKPSVVYAPGGKTSRTLDAAACSTLDVAVTPGVSGVSGHAHLDCRFADGSTLKGDLLLRDCP